MRIETFKKISMLFLILLTLTGCKGEQGKKESAYLARPEAGKEAVDFLYRDMEGKPFRLSEQKGKVIVLYFWRMKCGECKLAMPSLEALNKRYRDRGLLVVAVGADTMHSAPIAEVKDFLNKTGATFLNIRDSDGYVSEAYNVLKADRAFVIDRRMTIAAVKDGVKDWTAEDTAALVEKLLAEAP